MGWLDKLLGRDKEAAGDVKDASGDAMDKSEDMAGDTHDHGDDAMHGHAPDTEDATEARDDV